MMTKMKKKQNTETTNADYKTKLQLWTSLNLNNMLCFKALPYTLASATYTNRKKCFNGRKD